MTNAKDLLLVAAEDAVSFYTSYLTAGEGERHLIPSMERLREAVRLAKEESKPLPPITLPSNPQLNDVLLPGEVIAVLDAGKRELESRRSREMLEAAESLAKEDARVAAMLAPIQDVVRLAVPKALHPFIDWDAHGLRTVDLERNGSYSAFLKVPGCWEVSIQLTNHSGQWKIYQGFWTWYWDGGAPSNCRDAIESLPEALAVARECWVQNENRKSEIPF